MINKKEIRGSSGVGNTSDGAGLPEEIIMDILTMLPIKPLIRFRCLSKSWNNLFKTTNFAKLQLDYSTKNGKDGILIDFSDEKICYLDQDSSWLDSSTLYSKLAHISYPLKHEKTKIIGSCNGLVCYISESDQEDIIIWNPLTKDYKKIPTLPELCGNKINNYGFGYDTKAEDYKLLVHSFDVYIHITVYVYSLKLHSWKKISNVPSESPGELLFFNGFFNWVGYHFFGTPEYMGCFDIANETVKHIRLPKQFHRKFDNIRPCVLGGCLCLIGSNVDSEEVWTMKNYGTVAESWTKIFTMDNGKLLRLKRSDLKQYFKNDAISVYHDKAYLTYFYDLKHEVCRVLEIDGILPGTETWPAFRGSLVRPN